MAGKKNYARASERLPVTPQEIKGSLVNREGDAEDVALVWNISVQGLCLWAGQKHATGERVTLKVRSPWRGDIDCVVRWSRAIPDKSGFLLGLEAVEGGAALSALHDRLTKRLKKSG